LWQELFSVWDRIAGADVWFDDCLNAVGRGQASAAGAEIGAFLRGVGAAPPLLATSPFRRAWQTQLIGFGHAFPELGVRRKGRMGGSRDRGPSESH
jgi:hypothetical protein